MNIDARQDNDNIVLESEEKRHTALNLVRSFLWDVGAEAGYDKGHPYIGNSKLLISSDTPAEHVQEATEAAKEALQEFRDEF